MTKRTPYLFQLQAGFHKFDVTSFTVAKGPDDKPRGLELTIKLDSLKDSATVTRRLYSVRQCKSTFGLIRTWPGTGRRQEDRQQTCIELGVGSEILYEVHSNAAGQPYIVLTGYWTFDGTIDYWAVCAKFPTN